MLKDRALALLVGDILAVAASFWIMVLIRFAPYANGSFVRTQARVFVPIFTLWFVLFFIFELYNLRRINPNPRNIGRLALAIGTSTVVSIILFYLFPNNGITPKTNLLIIAVSSFALLVLWRRAFYKLFASLYRQHIAVIGHGETVTHLLEDLARNPHIGTVVFHQDTYTKETAIPPVHLVITDGLPLETLLLLRNTIGAQTLSLSGAYEELFGKIPLSLINDTQAITLLNRQPSIGGQRLGRLFEILIAYLILLLASPFLLIAIIAIALEDGRPFFYRQIRTGKNGKQFNILKLRSMRTDAEKNGAQWATQNDNRTTRVGKIIRKLHLDEIPQMWNIIRGDIALVGPRPERPEIVRDLETQIPYYNLRHSVRPGFTGWAQIKFRYARTVLDSKEKLEYDLYYIAHKNPLLDLGILLKTVQIIFTH